ncbi:MAG: flagellar basal body rod protein FlgB [Xanthomonadaceae bacterium]|nr:flagellar basal body rod protein FlgB [Xanthomonadaceae bacterium]
MSDSTSLFGIHGQALALRQDRMQMLATNLANADTPNFKARDLDFAKALDAASGGQATLTVTSQRHLSAEGAADRAGRLVWRVPTQPSLDGNTVETHIEQAAFAKAALEYRASLSFVEGRVSSLLTAITGQ